MVGMILRNIRNAKLSVEKMFLFYSIEVEVIICNFNFLY